MIGIALKISANRRPQLQGRLVGSGIYPRARIQQPAFREPVAQIRRTAKFVALLVRDAMICEPAQIERIGEIIKIGQWVGNPELS